MSFRKKAKMALEKNELYLKFRYSPAILKTLQLLKPGFAPELRDQQKLYTSVLPNGAELIFDIGGNEGFTAEIFTGLAARVIVAEPSQRNFRVLRSRFGKQKDVILIPVALSDREGKQMFFDNEDNYACSTLNDKWKSIQEKERSKFKRFEVQVTTLDRLIDIYGLPDLVKIDVEGHEEAVIKGLTRSVPLLSFEAMLPAFRQEAIRSVHHLTSLSDRTVFNFAACNQMQLENFVTATELLNALERTGDVTIEIFCSTIS